MFLLADERPLVPQNIAARKMEKRLVVPRSKVSVKRATPSFPILTAEFSLSLVLVIVSGDVNGGGKRGLLSSRSFLLVPRSNVLACIQVRM